MQFTRVNAKCKCSSIQTVRLINDLISIFESNFEEFLEHLRKEYPDLLVYGDGQSANDDSTTKINRFLYRLQNTSQSIGPGREYLQAGIRLFKPVGQK